MRAGYPRAMEQYERMVVDFLVIVSAPSVAPHLLVLTAALAVVALVVVALDALRVPQASEAPRSVSQPGEFHAITANEPTRLTSNRARAPSVRELPSHA